MRFRYIWTGPAMTFAERLRRTRDCWAMGIGRHLPVRIRYWVAIQEIARSTRDSPNVPATSLDEVLKNLDQPKYVS